MYESFSNDINQKEIITKDELIFCIFENRVCKKKTTIKLIQNILKNKKISNNLTPNMIEDFLNTIDIDGFQVNKLMNDLRNKYEKLLTLKTLNIHFISKLNRRYPKRLSLTKRNEDINVFYYKGNLDILKKKTIAIVGSRKSSEKNINKTFEIAKELSNANYNIISGYANGIDLAAHLGALNGKGFTTLVLSEGILKFNEIKLFNKLDQNKYEAYKKMLIISEYPMNLPWYSFNAMKRNSTIASLAEKVFIIESGKKGGTYAMGNHCIETKKPLYILINNSHQIQDGNKYFIEKGGKPLEKYLKQLVGKKIINNLDILENQKKITEYSIY